MKEIKISRYEDCIGGWFIDDATVCDRLIEQYELNSENAFDGLCGTEGRVDKITKDCKEMVFSDDNEKVISDYLHELRNVCEQYKIKYPMVNATSPWKIHENIKIQKYEPNQGYFSWHSERGSAEYPCCNRFLVFMTYLNDVDDCGETEFLIQNVKVKPKKGLTIIWPAEWTHTHRGITSCSQTKYILTGWYSFTEMGD
jgi:hypothetical protein